MMKGFWIALLAAVGATFGGMLLLGLPGAVIFTLASPVIRLLFGAGALEALPADGYWPIAIMITLLWPVCIVVGYVVAYRWLAAVGQIWRHASFVGILIGWGVLLSIVMFLMGRAS